MSPQWLGDISANIVGEDLWPPTWLGRPLSDMEAAEGIHTLSSGLPLALRGRSFTV